MERTRKDGHWLAIAVAVLMVWTTMNLDAQEAPSKQSRPLRVLLLGQQPDSHPRATHEYMPGQRIIGRLLQGRGNIQPVVVQADSPWADGIEMLDSADGAVLFLTEGAKWISDEPNRLAAFQRLAKRGKALCCLHWGMGTRDAQPVDAFVQLFGGCHGGPDRKYKVDDFSLTLGSASHPVLSGIEPFSIHDELYYALKVPRETERWVPLLETKVDSVKFPVAWAWERPDNGRSFGFSGLHFHENWKSPQYRQLIIQGILWTLHQPIPQSGLDVDLPDSDLQLPDPVK